MARIFGSSAASGQFYECKGCGRRFLVSDPVRLHDRNRRYAVDILTKNLYDKPIKDIWLRPLRKDWKRILNR